MGSIAQNLAGIRERMRLACERVGRSLEDVQLIGVTKTVPVDRIREAVKSGLTILGENYVQEAKGKAEALSDLPISWHFIGHLQSNKAKTAVEFCDWVHTIDREGLAKELDRHAHKRRKQVSVLIQVNLGNEDTKSGIPPEDLIPFVRSIVHYDGLSLQGLMALPPYLDDPEEVRPYFRNLRELLEDARSQVAGQEGLKELSMGMSHDFEVAIEEGATFVRVGTAIFGGRG
jgi:pyridoxal phosphate enzyme (YggS family)